MKVKPKVGHTHKQATKQKNHVGYLTMKYDTMAEPAEHPDKYSADDRC